MFAYMLYHVKIDIKLYICHVSSCVALCYTFALAPLSRPVFDRIKRRSLRIRRVKSNFDKWDCMKGCFRVRNTHQIFHRFTKPQQLTKHRCIPQLMIV